MILLRSAAAVVVAVAGGRWGWGEHGIVLDDGRPSAVARVMGAAQWCCSIYSNRLTHGPLELLEVKGCLHN